MNILQLGLDVALLESEVFLCSVRELGLEKQSCVGRFNAPFESEEQFFGSSEHSWLWGLTGSSAAEG